MKLAVLLVSALALAGCDRCGKKKAAPAASSSRPERDVPPPTREAPPTREIPRSTPEHVRRSAPLDAEQATAMMPPLAGAPLGAPATAAGGSQVRFPYCLGAANLAEAGKRAEQTLRDSGWSNVTARPADPAAGIDRYGIAAERDDYRLSITIEAAARPDCDASNHKFFATAAMNKVSAPATRP